MDPQVTLFGMGTGLPERTNAALKDDKHTALDLWQSQKMTWDEVLQVSEDFGCQNILFHGIDLNDRCIDPCRLCMKTALFASNIA